MFNIESILNIGGKLIDKLIPDPEAKAKAQVALLELQQSGELAKLAHESEMYKAEQKALTSRHASDMSSDSWLSKNIRPMTLIAILLGYFVFAFMSAYGMDANEAYVELLGQWGMLIMSFYFGGRSLEKIMQLMQNKKKKE